MTLRPATDVGASAGGAAGAAGPPGGAVPPGTARPPGAPGASATGNIYDLGYRRYEGQRLGRRHAIRSLYLFSLRGTFGIGRSGRAKIAPFGLAFLALLPALVAVGIDAITAQAGGVGRAIPSPVQY